MLQIVHCDVAHLDVTRRLATIDLGAHLDAERVVQPTPGQRVTCSYDVGRAARDNMTPSNASARSHVEHVIGSAHHHFVMLNGEHRVAEVAQL